MRLMRLTMIVLAGCLATACSMPDTASRNVSFQTLSDVTGEASAAAEMARSYDVRSVDIKSLPDLSVSEANGFYPMADVVWRGDPYGNRVEQVLNMFQTAVDRNADAFEGDRNVDIEIELIRFHGVTERTRFSIGGVYNIIFDLTVRDAQSGEVIEATRRVVGDLPAPGGAAAVMLEEQGQTEKVRVTDFLTGLLREELSGPITL